uniref:HECT domain-containing protein n=1 Tax=Macrostomum lignano TaxID=282301 RepID=A0A1I8IDG4_9PLAT
GCRGQACVYLSDRHESENTDLPGEDSRRVDNLKLHYPSEHLESVVFCAEPQALDRLIVHGDSSLLCSDQTVGCRVALIYRFPLAPAGSQSLSFLLSPAGSPGPDSPARISQLMSQAAALASDSLTRPAIEFDHRTGSLIRRALSGLLWNRQLCGQQPLTSTSATVSLAKTILAIVPDKWARPEPAGWEHGLHAIALCRVSGRLALAELRHQFDRMSAGGEILAGGGGGVMEPPPQQRAGGGQRHILRPAAPPALVAADAPRCRPAQHPGRRNPRPATRRLDGRPEHDGESNDSLVWSGFFCAKMVHLAALLRRQELKSLLDLFNAAMASLHNESAFVNGLFRPNLLSDRQPAGEAADATATALPAGASPPCKRGATCCCAFGLVPLLGCAIVPRDGLAADPEANTLVDWLHWLASEASASGSSETPCLFVRGEESRGRMLISWLGEAEFLQTCEVLFDPAHFLSPHGLRCTSRLLSREARDCDNAKDAPCRPVGRVSIVSLPWNYLVLEALKCWEAAYGQQLQLDYPTGSGMRHCLNDIINVRNSELLALICPKPPKLRHPSDEDALMLREYYEATSGRGVGGQRTGWSGVIANIAENLSRQPTLAVLTKPELPRTVGQILRATRGFWGMVQSLAKAGASGSSLGPESVVPIPGCVINSRIKAWIRTQHRSAWVNCTTCRQSRGAVPQPSHQLWKLLLRLSRRDIWAATMTLSGHGCFSRHQYLQGNATNAICSFCNSERHGLEAALHLHRRQAARRVPKRLLVVDHRVLGVLAEALVQVEAQRARVVEVAVLSSVGAQLLQLGLGRKVVKSLGDAVQIPVLPGDVRVHDQQERCPVGQVLVDVVQVQVAEGGHDQAALDLLGEGAVYLDTWQVLAAAAVADVDFARQRRVDPAAAQQPHIRVGQRHVVQEAASRVCRVVLDQHQPGIVEQSSEALDIVHGARQAVHAVAHGGCHHRRLAVEPRPAGRCSARERLLSASESRMSGSSRPGLSKRYSDSRMPRTSRL